jgi:hypothetical protein
MPTGLPLAFKYPDSEQDCARYLDFAADSCSEAEFCASRPAARQYGASQGRLATAAGRHYAPRGANKACSGGCLFCPHPWTLPACCSVL